MKKFQIVGLALVAVLALSAVLVASASAATLLAEWLINGAAVTTAKPSTTTGELTLEDTSNKGGVVASGILVGTVGENGEDSITEVLTLAGVTATLAAPILGKKAAGSVCEESATDIEISPEGLPWHSLLALSSETTFSDSVFSAGYNVSCLVLGIKISDECTSPTIAAGGSGSTVGNVAGGVEITGEATPLANCSIGGTGTGKIVPSAGNVIASSAGTLTVSE